MSEWQPIETAPKDGTQVLCAGPGYMYMASYCTLYRELLRGEDTRWFARRNLPIDPTHWMPLPAPPEL